MRCSPCAHAYSMISWYVIPDCAGISSRGTMRLLLIEDEKKVADFVVRGLRAERFAVDVAADGPAALQALAAYQGGSNLSG